VLSTCTKQIPKRSSVSVSGCRDATIRLAAQATSWMNIDRVTTVKPSGSVRLAILFPHLHFRFPE
jgi:hypothetical protein